MFRRKNQIQLLCYRSSVQYCSGDGTIHRVRQTLRPGVHATILVDCRKGDRWTTLTLGLPVQFALDRTPDGLFGRAMMRSLALAYCCWFADIGGSCDAELFLCARVPTASLEPALFGAICRELHTEAESFHQELRDRWNYAASFAGQPTTVSPRRSAPGMPAVRPGGPPQRPLSW